MTREEAIYLLNNLRSVAEGKEDEAVDMAIEALSTKIIYGEWQRVDEQSYFRKHYHKVCCSVCHKQGSEKYNYCPNCGADMRGGENE